jgi:hypothetical protein
MSSGRFAIYLVIVKTNMNGEAMKPLSVFSDAFYCLL